MERVPRMRARLVTALGWRPEWPFALVVILAWIVLVTISVLPVAQPIDADTSAIHVFTSDQSAHHDTLTHAIAGVPVAHDASAAMLIQLPGWAVMSVAMMLPIALPAVGHVGINSLRRRRLRAMALYVCIYVAIWVVFGAVVLLGVGWLRDVARLDGRILLACSLALAAAWQLTRFKRRAVFQCRRTVPLHPVGFRADLGCGRFASRHGWRCVRSCWALMLVMAVVGHSSIWVMAAMSAFVALEELTRMGRRIMRPSAGLFASAALLVAFGN